MLLDAARSVTTAAKETLVAPPVNLAAAAEDAVILGTPLFPESEMAPL